jgi:CRISPR-associated protein Cas5
MDINFEILKHEPLLDTNAIVSIRPLAPLSMVSDMPGSYYKTLQKPDKKMLCGLFENILGWHISLADRKSIYKDLKQARKKSKCQFVDKYNGSTYLPLLMDYFDIDGDVKIDNLKNACFYDDMWSRCFRRSDTYKHIGGCRNIDYSIIAEKYRVFAEIEESDSDSKVKDKARDDWFKNHIGQFPFYYSTPTTREFVNLDGIFKIKLSVDKQLLDMLSVGLQNNNIGYLGSSEGWVDIKIERI